MAEKFANVPMWVWVDKRAGSTVNWLPSETVNYRGRSSQGAQATTLGQTNQPHTDHDSLGYLEGYGLRGAYYKMAVQYDNNNPYTHLELTVTWEP